MTKTTTTCDIKNCNGEKGVQKMIMYAIFTTEQTEGRSTKPYFEESHLDMCEDCVAKALRGNAIWANGAMGHNEYYFKPPII